MPFCILASSKKVDMSTETGIVKRFSDDMSFGFIAPDDGSVELFTHFHDLHQGGYSTQTKNQRGRFEVTQGSQAANIRAVS